MADISTIEATGGVAAPAATEPSKAQVPGYVKGQLAKETSEALMKEIAGDPTLVAKLPKGTDELFKSWRTLEQESSSAVRVPAKDAPREAWDRYFKAIGRPDGPDGYRLSKPTNLPNGLPYSDRLEKWFRQELFDAGVSDSAAQKMFNDWNTMQAESFTVNMAARVKADEDSRTAAAKTALEAMQAEYKDALPQMMQLRDAAIARFGGAELVQAFQQARLPSGLTLDNDPRVNKMLIEIGKRMDVDTMVAGAPGSGGTVEPRASLPRTQHGHVLSFPEMEKDPRLRVKAE